MTTDPRDLLPIGHVWAATATGLGDAPTPAEQPMRIGEGLGIAERKGAEALAKARAKAGLK